MLNVSPLKTVLLTLTLAVLGAVACGEKPDVAPGPTSGAVPEAAVTGAPTVTPAPSPSPSAAPAPPTRTPEAPLSTAVSVPSSPTPVQIAAQTGGQASVATPEPPETPEPTATTPPRPTPTSEPTPTPKPGATPAPTATPRPTETPAPTSTPEPTPDPLGEEFFLEIASPQPEPDEEISFVATSVVVVVGRTRVDAAVTVQDEFVDVDEDGRFEATVELEEGPNLIEVVASVGTGEESSVILIVSYEPEQ